MTHRVHLLSEKPAQKVPEIMTLVLPSLLGALLPRLKVFSTTRIKVKVWWSGCPGDGNENEEDVQPSAKKAKVIGLRLKFVVGHLRVFNNLCPRI